MKTKAEIIVETANHYNLGNRGYDYENGGCFYTAPNGNHCALGRCMTEKALNDIGKSSPVASILADQNGGSLDNLLKEEYHGHSVEFWALLQDLHDTSGHWNDEGLSETGFRQVVYLLNKFKE